MLNLFVVLLAISSSFTHADGVLQFSANSRREIISQTHPKALGLARIGTCTGFFVKSQDNNHTFLSSSRHCFDYDAVHWCQTGVAKIYTTEQEIKCLSVAVGDDKHDTVIFEFENIARDRSGDFTYATDMPEIGTSLEMLGFPSDGFLTQPRSSILVSTHNCQVVEKNATNVYLRNPEMMVNISGDKVFRHNCSTYGGNSGGPMMIEGTRIVIGIPDLYTRFTTPMTHLEDGKSIQGVRVNGFVEDMRDDFKVYGLETSEPKIPANLRHGYLGSGSFTQANGQKLEIAQVNYYSNVALINFVVAGASADLNGKYSCSKTNECYGSKFTIKILSENQFSIIHQQTKEVIATYQRVAKSVKN